MSTWLTELKVWIAIGLTCPMDADDASEIDLRHRPRRAGSLPVAVLHHTTFSDKVKLWEMGPV